MNKEEIRTKLTENSIKNSITKLETEKAEVNLKASLSFKKPIRNAFGGGPIKADRIVLKN
jgi:hypothetical protein